MVFQQYIYWYADFFIIFFWTPIQGGKHSSECTLILTEGDSAKSLAVSGLGVIGRDRYGVFPLRGKILNVREATHKQVRTPFIESISPSTRTEWWHVDPEWKMALVPIPWAEPRMLRIIGTGSIRNGERLTLTNSNWLLCGDGPWGNKWGHDYEGQYHCQG